MSLTIVMYHYVRPLKRSRYPALKALDLDDFVGQLDYLERNYQLVRMEDVLRADEVPLPPRAALLTFDDGFSDHYRYVLPVLDERRLQGAFYPPSAPLSEGRLLDVHKIHLVLASLSDALPLVQAIDATLSPADSAAYHATYDKPFGNDPGAVIYTKRMLQHALPHDQRQQLVDSLFRTHVSGDERALAEEWYLSDAQLRLMLRAGMHVGGHGHSHLWLERQSREAQADDVRKAGQFLDALGVPAATRTFCYPYGSYNEDTVSVLREQGWRAAFTTKPAVAEPAGVTMFELPRLDTNALPRRV